MTFFGISKNILDEKISLNVSARLVNPACRAGVLTSRPNSMPGEASRNCNGNEVTPGDRRDVHSIGPDILFGDPDTPNPVES